MSITLTQERITATVKIITEYGGTGIFKCVQCGACSAVCPSIKAGFPILCRVLIKKLLIGQLEEIIEEPSSWACQACCRCSEVCPQGVKPQEVVFAFRRFQANELAISTASTTSLIDFHATGHAAHTSTYEELRTKVGLPAKPPTTVSDEKSLKELQDILENCLMGELGFY